MMDKQTLSLLTDEIQSEVEKLGNLEIGTTEYQRAVEGVAKLYDQKSKIEMAIVNSELEAKKQETNAELERLKQELEAKKHDSYVEAECRKAELEEEKIKTNKIEGFVKNGASFLLGVGGLIVTIWGAKKSWRYEEENSYSGATDKAFISRLFPKK